VAVRLAIVVRGRPLVGIIANPASGKDIRRLVAHGSTFDNNEKINIVRRLLLGLEASGVQEVVYYPDSYGIVARAHAAARASVKVTPLTMAVINYGSDSTEAGARCRDLGVEVVVTLGGDGTNRAVAKGCGDIPIVAISTGTNNVFPRMIEGTLAGLAAGLVATGVASNRSAGERVVRRMPRLDLLLDGQPADIALIDVVTSNQAWIGARALWEPDHLRDVVLSRIEPAAIGIASLGSALFPDACGACSGCFISTGDHPTAQRRARVPIAPGLIRDVPISEAHLLKPGEHVSLRSGPCTIALDGEREIELQDSSVEIAVRLEPKGPRVVDVEAAISAGAAAGAFVRDVPECPKLPMA
jgi:hypothetical protein